MNGKNSKSILQIIVYYLDYIYKLRVREDLKIDELKLEIENKVGINFTFNYLLFMDENILEEDDKLELSAFIQRKIKKFSKDEDYIFTIILREELQEKLADLEYIKCLKHNLIKGNIYCNQCKLIICKKCHALEHIDHSIITDEQEFYDAVYTHLNQFERRTKKTFGKTKASDMVRICIDLEANLDRYRDGQLDIVENLTKDVDENITKLKNNELIRLENIVNGGLNKVNVFKDDTKAVLNLHKNLKMGSDDKISILKNFVYADKKEKIRLLIDIQTKNSDLIRDTSKVEGVIDKLKNYKDHDIAKLIEINKDHSFYLTTHKLQQILEKFKSKIQQKIKEEKPDLLIKRMEEIKSSTSKSQIYYHNLNLAKKTSEGREILCILQSIEGTKNVSMFNLETKSITVEEVNFIEDSQYFFYVNSRSINIGGKLYVCGGDYEGKASNEIVEIDSESLEYRFLKQMDFGRSGHSMVNFDNKFLVVVSGANDNKSCESYNIEKNIWTKLPVLNDDRIGASLLIFNNNEIYCFFGKKYNNDEKKWIFVETIEKTTLDNRSSVWQKVYMKSKEFNLLVKRSFSGIIACPNERLFIVGGQCFEDGRIQTTSNIIEIDLQSMSFMRSDLSMPKATAFIDTNFYFHNANAIQYDNQASILFYSIIFQEMWNLENYE